MPEEIDAAAKAFFDQYAKRGEEELHPDLVPYLDESGSFPCLKHPLVFAIPFHPATAFLSNDQYAYKVEAVARALREGAWDTYVFLHERPYRIEAFRDIADHLDGKAYWELLREIWSDTENLWQWDDIDLLMSEHIEDRWRFMDEDERAWLDLLPDVITVYRGYQTRPGMFGGSNRLGWSWTTDREKAAWFARRLLLADRKGRVVTGEVAKADVIGYIANRQESEIVVDPENVTIQEDTDA